MNDQKFTLTTADAMNIGAQQASDSSSDLAARLRTLIADMEMDHRAVAGTTLPAFREGQQQLNEAFAGLTRWCSMHGVQLRAGHQRQDASGRSHLLINQFAKRTAIAACFHAAKTDLQINV